MPELVDIFDEIGDSVQEFTELYHKDKIIGKVQTYSRIGESDGMPLYNASVEIEDDKHIPLFEGKHRIIAQEGRLVLETITT